MGVEGQDVIICSRAPYEGAKGITHEVGITLPGSFDSPGLGPLVSSVISVFRFDWYY